MSSPVQQTKTPVAGIPFILGMIGAATFGLVLVIWLMRSLRPDDALLSLAKIAFIAPLAGWFITLLSGKGLPGQGRAIATGAMLISLIASVALFKGVVIDNYHPGFAIEHRFQWFEMPRSELKEAQLAALEAASARMTVLPDGSQHMSQESLGAVFSRYGAAREGFIGGVYIDNVTAVVLLMVTLLAFLIHLFSISYMHGDARFSRFMATMNLFAAGMIGLVIANNLLWVFACWELMGLCSFLLIGHFQEKPKAAAASLKAFFTTRLADVFMFVGMMMLFAASGTFAWAGNPHVHDSMMNLGDYTGAVVFAGEGSLFDNAAHSLLATSGLGLTLLGLMLAIGPFGKSAQFPFQGWLPDAMEGPTPVSAMIHAACMVSAGVYLTARLFPLFTPDVLSVIAVIGAVTAAGAGLMGLVQRDIKKVLAFSTMSQLGYMFLGIGVGAWVPALFHMLTHAFFKALLFLGAGSVIHGCHHEQDMARMGGLWRKMPVTAVTFWIGTLSLIGLPYFFAGYYSKEAILTDARLFGLATRDVVPYALGIAGAGLTVLYMLRLMFLVFHGKPRDPGVAAHVKESPWPMLVPLCVMAIGSFLVSWPIGAEKSSENLGITNITRFTPDSATEGGGSLFGPRPAQQPEESWLSYLWRKPASAWSADVMHAGTDPALNPAALNRADALYSDQWRRAGYDNQSAWKTEDLGPREDSGTEYPSAQTQAAMKQAREARHEAHGSVFKVTLMLMVSGVLLALFMCLKAMRGKGENPQELAQSQGLERSRRLFELLVTDGPSRLLAAIGRGLSALSARLDYFGVDGPVRSMARTAHLAGDGISKTVTGRVQDYVFLMIGLLMLFLVLVMSW